MEAGAARIVERSLRATGNRFACAGIAGRRFADAAAHAVHLRGGGCAGVLEALAAHRGS